ncbi:MAG: tyrosine-type recombinase/integrase [Bryobacteraceae bacterium]
MSLRKRENHWHYRFKYLGREHTANTGLAATERNRTSAQRIEAKAWEIVRNGGKLRTERVVFSDAVEEFLRWVEGHHASKPRTVKRIGDSFTPICIAFGDRRVAGISGGDILDYIAWRKRQHKVKDITIRADLYALSKFYRYAIKHNWASVNPVTKEDIPKADKANRFHIFTDDEERAYFKQAARYPKLLDLCLLMLYQGCRPEEALNLRVEDIHFTTGYMDIIESKSNAGIRTLKLRPESIEILKRRIGDAPWIFCGVKDRTKPLRLTTCDAWNAKVRKEAGLFCVIYDWRHTFATRAAARKGAIPGMPLATLAKILGHAGLKDVMKYVHPSQSEQDREMERLSGRKADGICEDSRQVTDYNKLQ